METILYSRYPRKLINKNSNMHFCEKTKTYELLEQNNTWTYVGKITDDYLKEVNDKIKNNTEDAKLYYRPCNCGEHKILIYHKDNDKGRRDLYFICPKCHDIFLFCPGSGFGIHYYNN